MYTVSGQINSNVVKTKSFSSSRDAYKYISSLLNTYEYQIQEEYDGINGHELVADYHTRFYVNEK